MFQFFLANGRLENPKNCVTKVSHGTKVFLLLKDLSRLSNPWKNLAWFRMSSKEFGTRLLFGSERARGEMLLLAMAFQYLPLQGQQSADGP